MSGGLSDDQRLLLYGIGGWNMVWCLSTPEHGIPYLFQSMLGGSFLRNGIEELRPGWHGFSTGKGVIREGFMNDDAPAASVTKAQLSAYARSLPEGLVTRLHECRAAGTRLAVAESNSTRFGYSTTVRGSLDRYRPEWSLDRLRDGRHRMHWAIRDREVQLLREALRIDEIESGEPTDLLQLLEMGA